MANRKKTHIEYYRGGSRTQFHIMGEKIRWNPFSPKNYHLPLYIKAAGYSIWGPKDGYKRKNSQTTAIGIITYGKATFSHNDKKYHLNTGDIFFTHKNANTEVQTADQRVLHKRFVIFDGSLVSSLFYEFQLNEQNVIIPKNPARFVQLFRKLFDSMIAPKEDELTNQAAMLFELMFLLQRECLQKIQSPVHEMIKYLGQNLENNITLDKLCKKFNISKRSMNRIFQTQFNCSPIQYFNRQRIDYASLLLRDSPQPIEQIAEKTGFNSSAHFSQYFKKTTGVTPSDYRKKA